MIDSESDFIFLNGTGRPAFDITYLVTFYDHFNHVLGRAQQKHPGPIHVQAVLRTRVPTAAVKITAEIYYVDKYSDTVR